MFSGSIVERVIDAGATVCKRARGFILSRSSYRRNIPQHLLEWSLSHGALARACYHGQFVTIATGGILDCLINGIDIMLTPRERVEPLDAWNNTGASSLFTMESFIFLYYFIRLDHLLFSPIKMSGERLARQALYPDKCQMHTSTSLSLSQES